MPVNLSTNTYRLQNANRFINDIITSNNYYFFFNYTFNQPNTSPQPLFDITSNNYTQVWNTMIAGKHVSGNNVYNMINNVQWVANTIYKQYDDLDSALPQEPFFVITTEGSYNHIWKVIWNNNGAQSTSQPVVAQANSTPYYQTSDGYQWKYMGTTPLVVGSQYNTSTYYPFVANTTVQAAAVPGAINAFIQQSNGAFYNNYVTGQFFATDIGINGSPILYNISNSIVSTVNGYYTGCLLYITGGPGQGQFATVTSYTSNTTGNILTLSNSLFPVPQSGSSYVLYPQVTLIGANTQTTNCVAYAVINATASNSVGYIAVLQPGAGYTTISNASITVNSAVGITNNALIRAILPPPGGHGANAAAELYSNSVGITVPIANSENNSILTQSAYGEIGLMNAPLFANAYLGFATTSGSYLNGEIINTIAIEQINTNVTVNLASVFISCNTANMGTQVSVGEWIYLLNGGFSQLVQVNSIANTSTITITNAAIFACTQATMYTAVLTGQAVVTNVNSSNTIYVTNCTGISFNTGALIVGRQSGVNGLLTTVQRQGANQFFNTFSGLYKYNATLLNGTFQINEQVKQGNTTAYLYALTGISTITLYFSNFAGGSFSNGTIIGVSSGAAANVTSSFMPDLVFGSGNILYLQNINQVTRANTQTEQFNLVFNF